MWTDLTDVGDQTAPVVAVFVWGDHVIRTKNWSLESDGSLTLKSEDGRFCYWSSVHLVRNTLTDQEIIEFINISRKQR